MTPNKRAHPFIVRLFEGVSTEEIKNICTRSGVMQPTIEKWLYSGMRPRIDLLEAVAIAAGWEIDMKRKASKPTTAKYKIVNAPHGRVDVFQGNNRVAYADEDGNLLSIGADGYASKIGTINHRSEIIGKIETWRSGGKSTPQA